MARANVDELLGRFVELTIDRFGAPGAFLALDDRARGRAALLLPKLEVPEGAHEGDRVEVFVYRDSEDRPIATTREPRLELGEVAFLEVTATGPLGAFVDWGLPKELLVPHREQTTDVHVGERHAIGLFVDRTGRLAGTMRVAEMLRERADFELDEWVDGEAWRNDPRLGLFVIVERRFVGRVPHDEPHTLARGEAARFRVTNVLPDGRIELSLRGPAHEELDTDADRVATALARNTALHVGDRSSPEEIRVAFGLSKKAFKRAVGRLLKSGRATIDAEGHVRLVDRPSR